MESEINYVSELFRIISGALRLDVNKVRNYSEFLADKLEKDGNRATASRLRKLLNETENQLRPASLTTTAIPVDSETRFPLLDVMKPDASDSFIVLSIEQQDIVNEFISVAKSRGQFEAHGLSGTLGMLLFGPPGTGKTQLAKQIALQLGLKLYIARLDGLISSYLGSTSKNIRAIFEFAKQTPCVLLLDEFDSIAKLRDDAQELGELKRVVNSFLQNIDSLGSETITLAATNHPQLLDSAVWRRFNYRIEFQYPASDIRKSIWQSRLQPINFEPDEIDVITDLSEGFTGADIAEVCSGLKRQKIVTKKKPAIKDAFLGLARLSSGLDKKGKFISAITTSKEDEVAKTLRNRNSKLYSGSHLASLLGVSKATIFRWIGSENAGTA